MTTCLSPNIKTSNKNKENQINDAESRQSEEVAVLYTSIHPFHNPRQHESRLSAGAVKMSGVLPGSGAEDQQGALLTSHVGIPPEITDSIQSWVDVQEVKQCFSNVL